MSSPQTNSSSDAAVSLPTALAFAPRFSVQPIFGVKRPTWRKDDDHVHLADPVFTPVREKILRRDNFSCRYCGFKSAKFQQVHHHDDDHRNQHPDNLMTVCNLCHQVHHLGMAGMRNAGFMAAVPELTQTEVNSLVRATFVVQLVGDQNTKDRLIGFYALLQARADALKHAFSFDISSPLLFAEVLSTWDDSTYAGRATLFADLRLVPTKEAFEDGQLDYYAANQRKQFAPENWSALARPLMG